MKKVRARFAGIIAVATTIALASTLSLQQDLLAADDEAAEFTHDGLQRVIDSKAAVAYVKPGTDFSVYTRFMILDCYVAFKKDWQKNYNRDQRSLSARVSGCGT